VGGISAEEEKASISDGGGLFVFSGRTACRITVRQHQRRT